MVRRVAAEWEPALGVLVRWPPFVPHDLLVAIARDARLDLMVEDDAAAEDARRWLDAWGVDPDNVRFHFIPGSDDAAWPRDYGPHGVFTEEGEFVLVDARYDLSTPDSALDCDAPLLTPWNGGWGGGMEDYEIALDDAAPAAIAASLGARSLALPAVLTGGNFAVDGRGTALSTCILTNENRAGGLDDGTFFGLAREELGVERYVVLPNFEDRGIQHVDCLLKVLEGERILVARPPEDHALFDRYQRIVDEHLSGLRAPSGQPYEILRIDTARYDGEELAAYTNSLVLNGSVYVPLFDCPGDDAALARWRAVLPGHEVQGFPFRLADEPASPDRARRMYPGGIGWRSFDALHCRTRAVWDPEMLHVSLDGVERRAARDRTEVVVTASIVPYSGARVLRDEARAHWRAEGEGEFRIAPLVRGEDGRFHATLAMEPDGADTIEVWIEAADTSGRRETSPRQAPVAVRTF
ncbi:MAG: agmatine deiminase family protein [Planctomycetota bacterium]